MQKFTRRSTQFTKVMRVMGNPSNTQMMFFMENNEGNSLEDTEDIRLEDREKDFNKIILSSKVIKDIKVSKVIKVTKVIQTNNKVTRGIHKEEINNVEISEVKETLEASTNLVTRWIHATVS